MTAAAAAQQRSELGHEVPGCLLVCLAGVEESDKLLRDVSQVRVEGEYTAIFAADFTRQALKLFLVIIRDCTFASYERLNIGNERYDAVRIEVVGT